MGDQEVKGWVQQTIASVLLMEVRQAEDLATCVLSMPIGNKRQEGEIRTFLKDFLGDSKEVKEFADELIDRRKSGGGKGGSSTTPKVSSTCTSSSSTTTTTKQTPKGGGKGSSSSTTTSTTTSKSTAADDFWGTTSSSTPSGSTTSSSSKAKDSSSTSQANTASTSTTSASAATSSFAIPSKARSDTTSTSTSTSSQAQPPPPGLSSPQQLESKEGNGGRRKQQQLESKGGAAAAGGGGGAAGSSSKPSSKVVAPPKGGDVKTKMKGKGLVVDEEGKAITGTNSSARGESRSQPICGCMGSIHKALGNCLRCGKIACEVEGWRLCTFCKTDLTSKFAYRSRPAGIGSPSRRSPAAVPGAAGGGGAYGQTLEDAVALKEKLLMFDQTMAERSRVFDDQADYFNNSDWLTLEEKQALEAKEEARRESMDRGRRQVSITFDIAGRRVLLDGPDGAPPPELLQGESKESGRVLSDQAAKEVAALTRELKGGRGGSSGSTTIAAGDNEGLGIPELSGRAREVFESLTAHYKKIQAKAQKKKKRQQAAGGSSSTSEGGQAEGSCRLQNVYDVVEEEEGDDDEQRGGGW